MSVFENMLLRYEGDTRISGRNALYEVMQQIALAGLHRGGFFEKGAFYGGTCLRIFHGLNRFGEDMDFSLLNEDISLVKADVEDFLMDKREIDIWSNDYFLQLSEMIEFL